MHLYAVNFIPLLSSLYMFRATGTPFIRSTKLNFINSHRYNHRYSVGCHGYLFPMMPGTESLQPLPIITTHSPSLQHTPHHYNPLPIIPTLSPSLQNTPHHYKTLPIITKHYPSLQHTPHHYNPLPIITTYSPSLQPTPYHSHPLPIITKHSP